MPGSIDAHGSCSSYALDHALLEQNAEARGRTTHRGMSATRAGDASAFVKDFLSPCLCILDLLGPSQGHYLTPREDAWMWENSTRAGSETDAVLWCSQRW
jgi:hypothetical protein